MTLTPAGTQAAARPGADEWFTPGRFAALLGMLIIACFPQVVFGLETFYFRDYQLFGYPLAFYHRESFWRGEIPLWNPYNDCGLPFLAQWNTLTLYPLSLFYLALPLPWSLGVFCLGHLFIAGMGMYFLAHRWTGNRLAAAVAGTAFAFNGLTWHALMWPNDIAALGWMPWVVLAMERGWQLGGRALAVAGLAGAIQMLAGAPEVILLTWVFVGGLWLMYFVTGGVSRLNLMIRAGVAGVLVAGLAAAQLLPFFELLSRSHRDTSYGDSAWAMPASGLANYLVPLLHCIPAHRGVYMQLGQYWTSSYYVGVGTVALALLAVWRVRRRRVWLLAGLILFSLLMALGDHGLLYPVLKKLAPQIGFMRFPIKFVVLATFAIPLLAAHGVAWLRTLPAEELTPEWRRLWRLALALIGLILVIVLLARIFPEANDDVKMTTLNGLRGAIFLPAILGCLTFLQRKAKPGSQMIFQSVLVVLLWMDIFTHVPNVSPTVVPRVYEADVMRGYFAGQDPKWDAEIRPGNARVMQTLASLTKMYWGGLENPVDDVFGRRVTLYDDANLLDHIPKLDGFYSLYLREVNTVITDLYESSNDVPRLKDFLGIARVNPPTNTLEWVARDTYAPLVTAGQDVYFGDDLHARRLLFNPIFDGRKMVCLPLDATNVVNATNHGAVKILATNFRAQRIDVQVDAAGPGMVVVAQAWYPAWHAYVDGQATRLWRANYAFQALEVPAGRHQVEIVYQDNKFRLGCLISLAALLACGGIWLLSRKNPQPELAAAN
jgi:Bacterial membrane protein YfhO